MRACFFSVSGKSSRGKPPQEGLCWVAAKHRLEAQTRTNRGQAQQRSLRERQLRRGSPRRSKPRTHTTNSVVGGGGNAEVSNPPLTENDTRETWVLPAGGLLLLLFQLHLLQFPRRGQPHYCNPSAASATSLALGSSSVLHPRPPLYF